MLRLLTIFILTCAVALAQQADRTYSVLPGQFITMQARAQGSEPFSYSWHKDGVAIGRTGSVLTLTAGPDVVGTYTVVIANEAGAVTTPKVIFVLTQAPHSAEIIVEIKSVQ